VEEEEDLVVCLVARGEVVVDSTEEEDTRSKSRKTSRRTLRKIVSIRAEESLQEEAAGDEDIKRCMRSIEHLLQNLYS
jgi:hypothetical protein